MADVRSASGPNDRDGNGLVDSSKQYKLAINGGSALPLKNWKGRTYSDTSTPHWNAIQAVKHEDGFRVLCEEKERGKDNSAGCRSMPMAGSMVNRVVSRQRSQHSAVGADLWRRDSKGWGDRQGIR